MFFLGIQVSGRLLIPLTLLFNFNPPKSTSIICTQYFVSLLFRREIMGAFLYPSSTSPAVHLQPIYPTIPHPSNNLFFFCCDNVMSELLKCLQDTLVPKKLFVSHWSHVLYLSSHFNSTRYNLNLD